jgi:hypothetical protein
LGGDPVEADPVAGDPVDGDPVEKASSALPELMYTMPFTMVAPPPSKGPPRAGTPFSGRNTCAVS